MFAVLQSFVILLDNQGNRGGNNSQIFFFFQERAIIEVNRFLPNHLEPPDCKQLHTP